MLVYRARLLLAIRTEITDNVEMTTEKNGNKIAFFCFKYQKQSK